MLAPPAESKDEPNHVASSATYDANVEPPMVAENSLSVACSSSAAILYDGVHDTAFEEFDASLSSEILADLERGDSFVISQELSCEDDSGLRLLAKMGRVQINHEGP